MKRIKLNEPIKHSAQQGRKRKNRPKESLGKEIMKITADDNEIEDRN